MWVVCGGWTFDGEAVGRMEVERSSCECVYNGGRAFSLNFLSPPKLALVGKCTTSRLLTALPLPVGLKCSCNGAIQREAAQWMVR